MSSWLAILAVHIWQEVTLFHLLVEFLLTTTKTGSLFDVIPLLRALSISVSPPLSHRVWSAQLGCDTHWMTRWLTVIAVHIGQEVSLLHFLMEFILVSAEPCSFFDVIPLLGALSVSVCPPLGQVILIVLTNLCGYSHWMVCWLGVMMIP
jgi:hypothetical protein